jgi:glyoxylase-like metal-dependent hydrolase (beta-lactamase superfamily II)
MDIYVIPGQDYDSNIYVIRGKVPTIIDTGTGFHTQEVVEIIQKIVPVTEIQQILLTHEHYDHVGGVLDFLQRSRGNAKIYAHRDVIQKLSEGKSTFAEMLGGEMPKIKVDVPLTEGTELIIGNHPYEILITPGHSIGSLCIYGEKNHVLFSGDTIFADGGFGRYDFLGGDFNTLLKSIKRLATLEVTHLYPGHGPFIEHHGKEHVLKALRSIQSLM